MRGGADEKDDRGMGHERIGPGERDGRGLSDGCERARACPAGPGSEWGAPYPGQFPRQGGLAEFLGVMVPALSARDAIHGAVVAQDGRTATRNRRAR